MDPGRALSGLRTGAESIGNQRADCGCVRDKATSVSWSTPCAATLGGSTPLRADRVIGAMVASQLLDPLIALAVVMALTPGLKVVARRLEWGAGGPWGHPEVFSGDLMTTAWEVVAAWEGRRREFMAPALLHAVRMRLDRRAQAWRREMGQRTEWEEVSDPEGSAESAPEQLARVLEDAADRIRLAPRRLRRLRPPGPRSDHGGAGGDDRTQPPGA